MPSWGRARRGARGDSEGHSVADAKVEVKAEEGCKGGDCCG